MRKIFFGVGALVIIVAFVLLKDLRRSKEIKAWIRDHPGTRLHWNFDPALHSALPALELATVSLGSPPARWASAVETPEAWFLELSASPSASQTSKWFVLIATRQPDGGWKTELKPGLVTIEMIEAIRGSLAPRGGRPGPAQ